jgi:O-antigen/teichoic acid export membrane protein
MAAGPATTSPLRLSEKASAQKRGSAGLLVAAYAGGNILSSILQMAGGLLTAKVVEPVVLGLFNSVGLVLGYAPFLQLGILNGLNRELPYFIGRGEPDRVHELAAAAQAWALLVGGLVAAALLAVSGWQLAHGHWDLAAAWAATATSAALLFYAQYYLQITYRTGGDFARLAFIGVVQSALVLALVVLVWCLGFYGLCLRSAIAGIVNLVLLWYWRPVRVAPQWKLCHLAHLFRIGAPIFGVGQLYSWWMVLDSTLVLKLMGTRALGLYSLALTATKTLQLLPDAVSQISYPRMAEQYGRTGALRDLVPIVVRPILLLMLGMVPIVVLGWVIIPPIVSLVLPRYVDSIPAAQWGLVPACVMCLAPVNNAFNVIKRQDLYVIAIVLGMLSYYGSLLWFTHRGCYLAAFPQAMTVGRLMFLLLCYVLVTYLWRRERTSPANVLTAIDENF